MRSTLPAMTAVVACVGILCGCSRPRIVVGGEEPAGVGAPPSTTPASAPTLPDARLPASGRTSDAGPTVRVALSGAGDGDVSSAFPWRWESSAGDLLATASAGERWRVERAGDGVRAVRDDGAAATPWRDAVVARAADDGVLSVGRRRYRGALAVRSTATSLVLVNVIGMEDYLRGVVPLEIGARPASESAAVEAQAIAARSYATVHLGGSVARLFDVTDGVGDQVYGGVDAEDAVADAAIRATRGLVLRYADRVVNAPYHSTCGGETASASDAWLASGDEPYLQRVSDRVPGTDRYYCDASPRFRWTRRFDGEALRVSLARYLASYAPAAGSAPGRARSVAVESRTPGGRVDVLRIVTERGRYLVRRDNARWVLRPATGEILSSSWFDVAAIRGTDGLIRELTVQGRGYGHGVGMCQWGAIGRARAGQDARAILAAYYPGTTVGGG